KGGGAIGGEDGIEADDPHAKPARAIGDDAPDVTEADDAQRLAGELDALEALLVPLAAFEGLARLRNHARQRTEERDRVLGGGDGVAGRRVHHDDAALRGRI